MLKSPNHNGLGRRPCDDPEDVPKSLQSDHSVAELDLRPDRRRLFGDACPATRPTRHAAVQT